MTSEEHFSCFSNLSTDSLTREAWLVRKEGVTNGTDYTIAIVVLLLLVTALPWNLLVIYAIIKKKLYALPVTLPMLNLSIVSTLTCVLVMPFNIVSGIAGEYMFGRSDSVRCKVCQMGIMLIILPWICIHTLALMAIDRFVYIKWPLNYKKICTIQCTLIALICIWIFSIAVALPPLFGVGEIQFSDKVATCAPMADGYTAIMPDYIYMVALVSEASVPVITLIIMYILIMCIIQSNMKKTEKLKESVPSLQSKRRSTITHLSRGHFQLIKVFSAIFISNFVTYIPTLGLIIAVALVGEDGVPAPVYAVAYLTFLSQTLVFPILQAWMIRKIRVALLEILKFCRKKFSRCNIEDSETTDISKPTDFTGE